MTTTTTTTTEESDTHERRRSYSDQLATLDEETKTKIQIEKIHERTVRPGLMRVPVHRVSTSEESEKVVIDVDHPLEGEIRFHLDKPVTWDPDNELVRFLDVYDLSISGIYTLQTHDVYIEQDEDSLTGWGLAYPPESVPRRKKAAGRLTGGAEWLRDAVASKVNPVSVFVAITTVSVAFMVMAAMFLGTAADPDGPIAVGLVLFGLLGALVWTASLFVAAAAADPSHFGDRYP